MRTDPVLAAAGRHSAPLPPAPDEARRGDGVRARGRGPDTRAPGQDDDVAATHPLAAFGAVLPPPGLLAVTAVALTAPGSGSPVEAPLPTSAAAAAQADQAADTREAAADGETAAGPTADETLGQDEQRQVDDLKRRDREVRQHEQAHAAAAGPYAIGGASFEYTTGPDQRRYATGGEVSIDTSKVANDPAATIRKAQIVYRAALAPAEPSGQDRRVASEAKKMEAEAHQELARQRLEERGGTESAGGVEEAEVSVADAGVSVGVPAPEAAGPPRGATQPTAGAAVPGRILDLVV